MAMTMNKGTGMSDAEWNELVKQRIEKEKLEDSAAKLKREKQKEIVRQDLLKQIHKEREAQSLTKTMNKEEWHKNL